MGRQWKMCWLKYHNLRNTCFRSWILFYKFALFGWGLGIVDQFIYLPGLHFHSRWSSAIKGLVYKKNFIKLFWCSKCYYKLNCTIFWTVYVCRKNSYFLNNSDFYYILFSLAKLTDNPLFGNYLIKFEC